MKYDDILRQEDKLKSIRYEIESHETILKNLNENILSEETKFRDLVFASIVKNLHDFADECHLHYSAERTLALMFYSVKRKYRKLLNIVYDEIPLGYRNIDMNLSIDVDKNSDKSRTILFRGFEGEDAIREFIGYFVPNLGFVDKIKLGVVESEYKKG